MVLDGVHFADIDTIAGNDWAGALTADTAHWTAPAGNALNWGLLYRFSVVTTVAPDPEHTRTLTLGLSGGTGPSHYTVKLMVPNTFNLFADGMED